MNRGRRKGSVKGTPKGKKRLSMTLSFYAPHKKLLDIWKSQTGLAFSELFRLLLEEVYDQRWQRDGVFGWQLRRLIETQKEANNG